MGKLTNGIFGDVNGKIGNIIGYDLNGQHVIRTVGVNTKHLSVKQLNNQMQMKVIMELFSKIETSIHAGFSPIARNTNKNYHNFAISYNKPSALKGFYPDVELDYSKIKISAGELPQPDNINVKLLDHQLIFTWDAVNNKDQVMLLAIAPSNKEVVYENSGAYKSTGSATLKLKPKMYNQALEVYISFINNERTMVANSLYLGSVAP